MIAYLEGTIQYRGQNYIIIKTGGVGYKVFIPLHLLSRTALNGTYAIYTYTYVKEDALDLYGFPTLEDLALFELLLGVSGIGPKTAIAIFANNKLEKIKEAIVRGDIDFFTSVPRLGRKNAQKIIIELRPKLGTLSDLDLTAEGGETKEIMDALKAFGFNPTEAKEAIRAIKDIEGNTSEKIRQALKFLGKK